MFADTLDSISYVFWPYGMSLVTTCYYSEQCEHDKKKYIQPFDDHEIHMEKGSYKVWKLQCILNKWLIFGERAINYNRSLDVHNTQRYFQYDHNCPLPIWHVGKDDHVFIIYRCANHKHVQWKKKSTWTLDM